MRNIFFVRLNNRLILLLGLGSLALVTFFLLSFLESNLSQVEYSEFAAFWSFLMGVIMGFTFPLETYGLATKDIDKEYGNNQELSALKSVITLLATLIIIFSPVIISSIFKGDWAYLPLLIILIFSFSVIYFARARLLKKNRFLKYSVMLTLEGILRVVFAAIIIFLFSGSGVQSAFAITAAALVVAIFSAKSVKLNFLDLHRKKLNLNVNIFKLIFANLIIILILNIGPLLIHAFDNSGVLAGKELNALTISRIPVFLGPVIQSLLIPKFQLRFSNMHAANKGTVSKVIYFGFIVATFWIVFFGFSGKILIEILFGKEAVSNSSNLFLLGSITGLYIVLMIMQSLYVAFDLNGEIGKSLLFGFVALVLINFLPLPVVPRTELACAFAMGIPVIYLLGKMKSLKLN